VTLALLVASCASPRAHRSAATTAADEGGPERDLFIVAHEDDDLLFLSPTLANAIADAHDVRTIYVTAGNADQGAAYWSGREQGDLDAYAQMAGVNNAWVPLGLVGPNGTLTSYALRDAPWVSLVFLRLPNSSSNALEGLWRDRVATLTAVDGSATYAKTDLIGALSSLMADSQPTTVHTQDETGAYGNDHNDHLAAALFACAAESSYLAPHVTTMYRGYNITGEPANLSADVAATKWNVFLTYAAEDSLVCRGTHCVTWVGDYAGWAARQYPIGRTTPTVGPIFGMSGQCLTVVTGQGSAQATLQLGACIGGALQNWSLLEDGTLRGLNGQCLAVEPGGGDNSTSAVMLSACSGSPGEQWALTDASELEASGGECLEAGGAGPTDGAAVHASPCSGSPGQVWATSSSVKLYGDGGGCVDVTTGSPQVDACADTAGQVWALTSAGELRTLSGKCMAVSGDESSLTIDTGDCVGSSAQKWVAIGGQLVSPAGCLGVPDGTSLQVRSCDLGADESWEVLPSGASTNPSW
jgi:LmbE family N-acetylglucosaminyl deacetylase